MRSLAIYQVLGQPGLHETLQQKQKVEILLLLLTSPKVLHHGRICLPWA